jgi:putative addiction module killer protein
MPLVTVQLYQAAGGVCPFEAWAKRLDAAALVKVTAAVSRLEDGSFSNVKGVGKGVFERKIDFGPGYRIYFGKDGEEIVILLGGGDKRSQDKDISAAQRRWSDYKARKQFERGKS